MRQPTRFFFQVASFAIALRAVLEAIALAKEVSK